MNKKILLILLSFCYNFFIFSQNDLKKVVDSVTVLIELSDKQNLKSDFKGALEYATLAVKYANTKEDKELLGRAYICLANAYQMDNDNDNSENYFKIALSEGKALENYFLTVASLNGLGNVYSQDINTLDKAAGYYKESVSYALEVNNIEHIYITYINIAGMYLDFEKADKAYQYILKSEEQLLKFKKNSPLYVTILNLTFAKYYMQKKLNSKAIIYIEKARKTAETNALNLDLVDIYELKSQIHQKKSEYDLAIESLKKQQYYKDLHFNSEKRAQIEMIKAEFDVSEYERAAKISESRTRATIFAAIGIVLLLSSVFLAVYLSKKRKTLSILEKKNRALLENKNEVEHANKLKSELLVNISHELRTPLYGILGATSMLIEESQENPNQIELLNSLKFSGEYLKSLVNNLLRNEEIETKNISLKTKPTNLHQLIIDIVHLFMLPAKENQNKLILNISESVGKVYVIDDDKLSEILVNLVSNANKFTSAGKVEVKVTRKKKDNNTDSITFSISDTGIGIPEEKVDTIFESFKQVETNTIYGAGLGLSIVKSLIELMGGKIGVKSEVNIGTEFSFTLDFETIVEIDSEEPINNQNLNLLVVEDNKINQIVTKKLLTTIGYKCVVVKNGLEAVEICKTSDFDLVLMDINMPVMNGLDATKAIKTFKPELKIIALTALEISEIEGQCAEAGMDDIINKPITQGQLKTIIETSLV